MKKGKSILLFLLVFLILMVNIGCSNNKKEENAVKNITKSNIYKEDELNEAMDALIQYFEEKFVGVNLINVSYVGDENKADIEIYKKEYAVDNLIILNTTFNTESTIGDIPFDINSEYKDYPWIMVKNEEGKWVVRSWGY